MIHTARVHVASYTQTRHTFHYKKEEVKEQIIKTANDSATYKHTSSGECVHIHLCKIALVHNLCFRVHIPIDAHQTSVSIQDPVRLFRCPFPFSLMFSCSCRIAILHGLNLRSREEQNRGSVLTEHEKVCITCLGINKTYPSLWKDTFLPNYQAFSLKSFAIGGFMKVNRTAEHDPRDAIILTEN